MTVRTPLRRAAVALALLLLAPLLALVATTAPAGASEPKLVVRGGGWGHGVGMSQYGAEGMARQGHSAAQILGHYYQGTSVGTAGPWNDIRVLIDDASVTHLVKPESGSVTVSCPGGSSVTVSSSQTLKVAGNKDRMWIKRNDVDVCGSPFDVGADGLRAQIPIEGKPVILSRDAGAALGTYGRGTLELSTGVAGCAQNSCAVIRGLTMDRYLYGLAEVPSSWSPATLQAQAITGRSYAALKDASPRAPGLYDILRTTTDQYYAGLSKETDYGGDRWKAAVDATSGQVLTYGGKTISANYFSTSGGRTENSEYVWTATVPYLRGVADPTDSISPRHSWTREYTLREIGSWFGVSNVRDVRVVGTVGRSGRIDKATVEIVGSTTKRVSGTQFRQTINGQVPDSRSLWSTKVTMATTSFPDVPPNSYFAGPVRWLTDEGITTGVGDSGLYKPHEAVSRAQMVTFLWRMMGSPTGFPAHGFPDVPGNSYYDAAVRWAKARGITTGVGGTNRFAPNEVVNRAQMSVFLHRTAGLKAPTARHGFPDVPRASYYDAAVSWASQNGITTGVGDTGLYKPLDAVTRGQMAAFLHRTASTDAAWAGARPPTAP